MPACRTPPRSCSPAAFAGAAVGYGLFSARGRDWRGAGIAVAAGLAVFLPNLLWNIANSFATIGHVADDADPGKGFFNPLELVAFTGAQLVLRTSRKRPDKRGGSVASHVFRLKALGWRWFFPKDVCENVVHRLPIIIKSSVRPAVRDGGRSP